MSSLIQRRNLLAMEFCMLYLITSDLHLGSPYSQTGQFINMLQRLKDSVTLVLAGDIIDAPGRQLDESAQQALEAIQQRALNSPVIWLEGNHDEGYRPAEAHKIQFAREYVIADRLYISHGDCFDMVLPNNRWFTDLFKLFHQLRISLGADPVHVADYAKRYKPLYRVLCHKVMQCATDYARLKGFETVVCGHVHFAEDTIYRGVRYINLAAWTEPRCYCLLVDDHAVNLVCVDDALQNTDWFR
ncbi:MAG: metallophosphoesterase [Pseudomonadales bacterium]|nr:metallophosphoesterase [Pseudomonadales bacterium]